MNLKENSYLKLCYFHVMTTMNTVRRLYRDQISLFFLKGIYSEPANLIVLNGPFKNTSYIGAAEGSQLLPKLIGSYEEPIHNTIRDLVEKDYDTIIDIGSAEGYYAVGFKINCPQSKVIASDISDVAREACGKLTALNKAQISLQPALNHKALSNHINGKTLVFVDIEGAELDLLDNRKCVALSKFDILCEIHHFINPKIAEVLTQRFSKTHRITPVRDYDERKSSYYYSDGSRISNVLLKVITNEHRPKNMSWILFEAKAYE